MWYPRAQHGLARSPSNSEKRSIRQDFLLFVDENRHPDLLVNTQPAGLNYGHKYIQQMPVSTSTPLRGSCSIQTLVK